MYILQSKVDGHSFEVEQKVIDASELLKNVCAITEVAEPIIVDCSSFCLSLFITLINHYDAITDEHDVEFENQLFAQFTLERFVAVVKEMCVLDSDFFLDCLADLILDHIDGMGHKELQQYFQLDNDFSVKERKAAAENRLEFLLSKDVGILKFPFPSANFLSLRNKFYIPMNVLLARVVQRSNQATSFELSLINKALKNESDRYPIKVRTLTIKEIWTVTFGRMGFSCSHHDIESFDVMKSRKIISDSVTFVYESQIPTDSDVLRASYMDFVYPSKTGSILNVEFSLKTQFYDFNPKLYSFPSMVYSKSDFNVSFVEFYDKLVAEDFSKEIKIEKFEFEDRPYEYFTMHKKANASKFHKIEIQNCTIQSLPNFINFFTTYVESDGVLFSHRKLFDFVNSLDRKGIGTYHYPIEHVLEYLQLSSNEYCSCKTGCRAKSGCKCRKSGTPCNFRCHVKNKTVECSNNE